MFRYNTKGCRTTKLGQIDTSFRRQNALRGMLEVGWLLVSERKSPTLSTSSLLHCTLDPIPYTIVVSNASTHSAYSKFDPYLFNTRGKHPHGKDKLFHEWGYTVEDALWLQKEIERQAREKYVSGNYELGRLNFAGQRISIRIEIPRRNGDGTVSFISGWMVEPTGEIRLTTPYGGE